MTDVRDPGRAAADKILDGLEDFSHQPADVARQARRLRAHIDVLRDPSFDEMCNALADCPLASEAEGTAEDPLGDDIILLARRRAARDAARLKGNTPKGSQ